MSVTACSTGGHLEVLVLLSGGLDSAACLAFYRSQAASTHAVFIDYGQPATEDEGRAAQLIARHFGTPLSILALSSAARKPTGLIQGRNAFLLLAGLMEFPTSEGVVAIGVHRSNSYYDCSQQFLELMGRLFDGYTDGRVRPAAPFLSWTKREIWTFAVEHRLPIELTYSCESGGTPPCGRCISCLDMQALRAG
jgi:7-cyano-7-deazaguanine synthase